MCTFIKINITISLFILRLVFINGNIFGQVLNFSNKLEIESDFYQILDVDVDSKGNIYILDAGEQHIKKFNSHGELRSTIGKKGQGPAEFQDARLLEIDKNDRVIVCNFGINRFDIISAEGEFLNSFKTPILQGVAFMMGVSAFKIDSKNNLILALIDRYTGTYVILRRDWNGKTAKEYFHIVKSKNSLAEYRRDQHPEIKSEFLMTIDESDNIYFTFSDEKIIMAMNTAGDTLYHIHLNREPIAYNTAEKKRLLAEETKYYIDGYAAGVKRELGKAPKSISPSKLPKDTYRYKPYTLALMSPKKNQLWTLVPVQNEPTQIMCNEFLNGNLQRSFALNIPAANLIFNAFQEIVMIKNNYLFQIASEDDGLQRVIRYNID